MGIYSSLPLLGGAIAGMAGGVLNDWCIAATGNRRWSRSGIAATGKGLAAVLLLVALSWYDNPYVFCGFLFAVKLVGDWSITTSWGVVTDIGGRVTASVFAFNNAVAGIGFIVAPVLFGYLAQHYGWTAAAAGHGTGSPPRWCTPRSSWPWRRCCPWRTRWSARVPSDSTRTS